MNLYKFNSKFESYYLDGVEKSVGNLRVRQVLRFFYISRYGKPNSPLYYMSPVGATNVAAFEVIFTKPKSYQILLLFYIDVRWRTKYSL